MEHFQHVIEALEKAAAQDGLKDTHRNLFLHSANLIRSGHHPMDVSDTLEYLVSRGVENDGVPLVVKVIAKEMEKLVKNKYPGIENL